MSDYAGDQPIPYHPTASERVAELETELAKVKEQWEFAAKAQLERSERAETTMREVAEELRYQASRFQNDHEICQILLVSADRLSPPPVVENPSA